MKKLQVLLALVAVGMLYPMQAEARSAFPGHIQNHLQLPAEPPTGCLLCHGSQQGGGPVVQPFGKAMVAAGLSGGSSAGQVGTALDALASNRSDSDGDGATDVDELKAGTDPNPGGAPVEYGCGGGHIAPRANTGWLASVFAVATFLVLASRRKRGQRNPLARG